MLDRAIEHGQEHRRQYRGSKLFDRSCRNHGSCDYCRGNRMYSDKRRREAAEREVMAWTKGKHW